MPLGVIDILKLSGVLVTPHSRFVRHQDDRYPVAELRRNNWLEVYQGYQRRPVFHRTDQLISFYGLAGTRAAFFVSVRESPYCGIAGEMILRDDAGF